jgi:predicted nucleic acid-binding Zn ribbon protein
MAISLGQALEHFISKSRMRNDLRSIQVEEVWERVVGKTISAYTERVQLVNQTLFITTSVAPLKTELLYQKQRIIERVNEEMGEKLVSDVVIQ